MNMNMKRMPHYAGIGSMDTDEPRDDDSTYSSMDSDTSTDDLAVANRQLQSTSSKAKLEVTPTPSVYRGIVGCDTSMDMYFDTLLSPQPLRHRGRRSTWPEIEPLEKDAPQKVLSGLSCADTSLDLYATTDASSTGESAGASRTEKSRHNLPRGAMVGRLSCGSRADLCAPLPRSQSKQQIARAGSKQLSAVTEHQTFVDPEVPDMGAPVGVRPPAQPSGFVEALQMMFHMHPSMATSAAGAA